jgi:DNA gyrase subunit A
LSGSEAPRFLVRARTTDILYLVTEKGQAAATPVHTLPEAGKLSDGVPFHRASALRAGDKLAAMFALPAQKGSLPEETCVLTVTRGGMLKKSLVGEMPGATAQAFTLVRVNEGDALGWVALTDGKKDVLMVTALGFGIRFSEEDVRPMGLVAAGVNGIKLGIGDQVVGMSVPHGDGDLLVLASDGRAKRIALKDFPAQGRYGRGVIVWELARGTTLAGLAFGKGNALVTVHLRKAAAKSARLDEAGLKKRSAVRGDAIVEVKPGDEVTGLTEPWAVERYVAAGPVNGRAGGSANGRGRTESAARKPPAEASSAKRKTSTKKASSRTPKRKK